MNRLIKLFLFQFTSYFLIVANTRAITSYSWVALVLTDALISAQGFLAVKLIAEGEKGDWKGITAYAVGGAAGSVVSLITMRRLGL